MENNITVNGVTYTAAACKECGRYTFEMLGNVRLNRNGICPTCIESAAEVAADDAETLAKADRLRRRMAVTR